MSYAITLKYKKIRKSQNKHASKEYLTAYILHNVGLLSFSFIQDWAKSYASSILVPTVCSITSISA